MTEIDFVLMLQDHQGEDRAELGGVSQICCMPRLLAHCCTPVYFLIRPRPTLVAF